MKRDIPQVVDLRSRCFQLSEQPSPEALAAYFEEVFFHNPWYDEDSPSLVYVENDGTVVGFQGVIPRPMYINGRRVRTAVGTQFMVEPSKRGPIGIRLLSKFLSGTQDISFSDANSDAARAIWERLGAETAMLCSTHWTCPLQPTRHFATMLRKHRPLVPIATAMLPFCGVFDALASRVSGTPFHKVRPDVTGEPLTPAVLSDCYSEIADRNSIWPEYDPQSLEWLWKMLQVRQEPDNLQGVKLEDKNGNLLGWYLYFVNPGSVGQAVQVAGNENSIDVVLDHLLYDAWRRGVVAVAGRFQPSLASKLSQKYCLFKCGRPWTVVHSQSPELLLAIHKGDAFITRLEGEWWMSF